MKTLRMLPVVALVVSGWITSYGQPAEAEVPGDHFSLEGALELFKKSSSPEEFEKMLNSPDSKVNNLDLNGDGYIDYIRVHDRYKGNVHVFILQAVVSEDEVQDVAVIELEKLSNGKAVLQIIGDEDIYGVTTIIEPTQEVRTYAGTQTTRTVVNVWAWPSVQYVYGPYYAGWVSPWGWYHRPVWWSRWRPIAYIHYYPIWHPYHHHYVICHTRRIVYAHDIYRPYRRTSVIVHHRYNDRVTRYRETYRDGHRRNDGRQYARDDRSGTTNDYQRGRDASQRSRDDSDNRRSTIQREASPSLPKRSTSTPAPQRTINQVRTESPAIRTENPVRRAEPDRDMVRRQQQQVSPPSATTGRSATAPAPQRSSTSQPHIRSQAPRSPSEVRRSSSADQRPAAVEPARSSPQVKPSSPVQRSSPAPQRSSDRPGRTRSVE